MRKTSPAEERRGAVEPIKEAGGKPQMGAKAREGEGSFAHRFVYSLIRP